MPLVLANRVQETGTANTTVSFTLTGAVPGFQSFATIGNTNTTYYSATDGSGNWEVGLGTYSTTGPTLTRTTIYASSNAGSAVTFSGVVSVFVTYPSGRSVNLDASGNVSALGTVASGTWQGSTVGVAYGGTGVTTSTGANSVVLRDADQNIAINRLNQGLLTTTASGGTTVLTVASAFNQALVGTGGHTYRLPDATTLSNTTAFQFNNNATGTLTIQNNASTTVGTIASGGAAGIALLSNATVAGTWDVHAYIPENVTWGTNALALGSTVISGGTWQGGTIQSGYGGTGLTTFAGANNALYSTSASALAAGTLPIAAGGTGETTRQNAMDALAGAVTSGQYLRGNGTDVVMSAIQAADVPTLNQNTTGTASNVTGIVAVANGGTGTATPSLVAGTNITISGSFPNQTINASGGGGLTGFTAAESTVAPNATVYVDSLTSSAASTNADVAFVAKGTGATLAQVPDSTTTGGNKRGASATDWQKVRSAANQVAAGTSSTIAGGENNRAGNIISFVGGGGSNSSINTGAAIAGGFSNTASGGYSAIVGGASNTASSPYAFVGGGTTNAADTATTGYNVVVGGANNIASGNYSFVGGGGDATTATNRNTASGTGSAVVGGFKNSAAADYSVVGGGYINNCAGFYSTISGGQSNTINQDYATIAGGRNNTASGYGSFIAGAFNTTSGTYSAVVGGSDATASATQAVVVGGSFGKANAENAIVLGAQRGITRSIAPLIVIASGGPLGATDGASQSGVLVLARQTTDATATRLTSNTSAASTTNQVILPNNSAYYFRGSITAGVTGGGNSAMWSFEGGIKRGANAAATTLIQSVINPVAADAGASTWVVALSADTTNGGLAVTVTGQASTTIRWVCKIETTEVTF